METNKKGNWGVCCFHLRRRVISSNNSSYSFLIKTTNKGPTISSMRKNGILWKWPNSSNILDYLWKDVVEHIEDPKQIGKRSIYSIPELEAIWKQQ